MEILNDILEVQKKQSAKIEELTKEIQQLKSGANKPIVLDSAKVANDVTQHLNLKANEIVKATQQLQGVASKIPSAVNNTWGVNTSTKIWLAALLVVFGLGWYFAPSAVSSGQELYYKQQLENREQQIEKYRSKNPDTAKKYFD